MLNIHTWPMGYIEKFTSKFQVGPWATLCSNFCKNSILAQVQVKKKKSFHFGPGAKNRGLTVLVNIV